MLKSTMSLTLRSALVHMQEIFLRDLVSQSRYIEAHISSGNIQPPVNIRNTEYAAEQAVPTSLAIG